MSSMQVPSTLVRFVFLFLLIALSFSATAAAQTGAYDEVDPFIGTAGGGNTFPGATLPFGMIQWSPDTNTDGWYFHDGKQLYGFSLTHVSGAGCPLYGDFAVLPTADELHGSPGSNFAVYATPASHDGEQAHPGYYAVKLADGTRVELTVAERAGIARFVFPDGAAARLLVNAGSSANSIPGKDEDPTHHAGFGNHIEIKPDGTFSGWSSAGRFCGSDSAYKVYVAGKFDKLAAHTAVWQDDAVPADAHSAEGKHTGAWLDFGNQRQVLLKVGVSFVSEAGPAPISTRRSPAGTSTRCASGPGQPGPGCSTAPAWKAEPPTSGPSTTPAYITLSFHPTCSAMKTATTSALTARCIRWQASRNTHSMPTFPTGTFIATRCSGRRCSIPSGRAT
jgi:putative alpha-1,2-mannosidase